MNDITIKNQENIIYREKLKKIKLGYEFINNTLNCKDAKLNIETEIQLENIKEILKELYEKTYLKAYKNDNSRKELIANICCLDCGSKLYISDLIDYSYVCLECDKNLYDFEVNTDKNWYNEEDINQTEISSSFN